MLSTNRRGGGDVFGCQEWGNEENAAMDKEVIGSDVPETGGPFNLCVRYGDMIFVSGLPPCDEEYASKLREARAKGLPLPPFPDLPFERQVRIVRITSRNWSKPQDRTWIVC